MHDDDPVETLYHLLSNEWDSDGTMGVDVRIHTGWYDYAAGGQQVTVTNPDENTIRGGETGITAMSGSGSTTRVRRGVVLVNCWSGTRDECRGIGPDDSDMNPKGVAHDMATHTDNIIDDHSDGVIDGTAVYNSLTVDSARRRVDTEGQHAIYRWELEVVYTYQS